MKKLNWIFGILLLTACQHNRLDVNVSDVKVDLLVKRYDKILFDTDSTHRFETLKQAYKSDSIFINYYTEDILRIGNIYDDDFARSLNMFCTDSVINQVAQAVLDKFHDFESLSSEIRSCFQHYRYYFPDKKLPAILTYLSGFNQSLIVDSDFIGIGLDKYLGSDCIFYQYLGIPQYKIANMYPEKMIPDIFYAIALTEYPNTDLTGNLLSEMVYEGKLLYFTEAMCPDLPDTVLMGYSAKQLDWCKKNEVSMWSFWAEHKLLYSLERLDLQKYIGDAPFTNTFSGESPGRTGVWVGLQIVRAFMKQHPEVSLEMLMEHNNGQTLLSQSGYFPE